MTLEYVVSALQKNPRWANRSFAAWMSAEDDRAQRVAACRRYIAGDHPANLSPQMREMLRVNSDGVFNELNDNYMDIVVQTVVDRLEVTGITAAAGDEAEAARANAWASDLLAVNQFDGTQTIVHENTVSDGDTYVLVDYDALSKRARMTHEPAFDGDEGMLVYYEVRSQQTPSAAIKVWHVPGNTDQLDTRINVYYADRVEKYIAVAGGALSPLDEPTGAWTTTDGRPIGMPVIHFRNRVRAYDQHGTSEIIPAIPLQNALNRTLVSMIMASELTAFQIRYAVGWQPPAALSPGMWVTISPDRPLEASEKIDIGALQQGELMPYLESLRYLSSEIGRVTRTPSPEFGGSDAASGEALKQREIGLLGKVKRLHVTAGNAWEQCVSIAAQVEMVYGGVAAPVDVRWVTMWRDAELRNDASVIDNALKIKDLVGDAETLRMMSPVTGHTEDKISAIMAERTQHMAARLQMYEPIAPSVV